MTGTIITFYSFKGGVGRSAAVANTARLLAAHCKGKQRVLVIDWDLDAPGLYRYFPGIAEVEGAEEDHAGVLDLFEAAFRQRRRASIDLSRFVIPSGVGRVDFMTAGKDSASFGEEYRKRLRRSDWAKWYLKSPEIFDEFRKTVAANYRYCLIDSRTGYSDFGSVCTAVLPDKLVAAFTPNSQNLRGLATMIKIAVEFRRNSSDTRPLTVYPLPSKIEARAPVEQKVWLQSFQDRFEKLFEEVYGIDGDLSKYFDSVQVPHEAYYAYGERVAVLDEERSQPGSCRHAYEKLTEYLADDDYPWEERPESPPTLQ